MSEKQVLKFTNTKNEGDIKISIALSNTSCPGIFLKQNEFTLAYGPITGPTEMQQRKGFVTIENFDNSLLNLPLGQSFSQQDLENAISKIETFTKD